MSVSDVCMDESRGKSFISHKITNFLSWYGCMSFTSLVGTGVNGSECALTFCCLL